MTRAVSVFTTDGSIDDLAMPIPENRIREVASDSGFFTGDEDRAIAKWLLKVSAHVKKIHNG